MASEGGFYFKNKELDYQLLRTMGHSVERAAELGECFSTASRINEHDPMSWIGEWNATAGRVESIADDCLSKGDRIGGREALLRASEYYRTADFYVDRSTGNLDSWSRSVECFNRARKLLESPFEKVDIPFEDTRIPGYFYPSGKDGGPTLLIHTGFDGTAEELHYDRAMDALRRGYNVLTFEGPGQGAVIRRQGIPFRPDWENVVTPVVDYLLSRDQVDPDRIALMGLSMGGYLAPRAATREHRISACIANGGILDLFEAFALKGGMGPDRLLEILERWPDRFNSKMEKMGRKDLFLHWSTNHGQWVFGARSPSEYFLNTREYNLRDLASEISCPTLVVDSEEEHAFPGQAGKLFEALSCPKDLMVFKTSEGAGLHCQVGALTLGNQRILNWLDGIMGTRCQ